MNSDALKSKLWLANQKNISLYKPLKVVALITQFFFASDGNLNFNSRLRKCIVYIYIDI